MTDLEGPGPLISRPARAWGALGRSQQFALYMRGSLLAVVVFVLGTALMVMWSNEALQVERPGVLVADSLWIGVLTAAAVLFLQRVPHLRAEDQEFPARIFTTGLGLTAATGLVGLALIFVDTATDFGLRYLLLGVVLTTVYVSFVRRRWTYVAIAGAVAIVGAMVSSEGDWTFALTSAALMTLVFPLTVVPTLWCVRLMKEADRATELQRSLTIAEERLRFSQELHDTMGQHLAAMSVKSELALALARRGDDRLEGELEELQKLTGTSMAELREVVDGYRRINLATEIAGARHLLESANIQVTVVGDAFDVPERSRELAAWFVREASTNVLKHADATEVELRVSGERISMLNDGAHPSSPRAGGLEALRRRAGAGHLAVEHDGAAFTVALRF